MTTVKQTLIGFQILTLCCGLMTLGAGCGGGSGTTSGGMSVEDQVKQTDNAKGAMEAASKAQKTKK